MTIFDILRERGIEASNAVGRDGRPGALSMSPEDLRRFMTMLVGDPLDYHDELTMHMIGRPQDGNDRPWDYELVPGWASEDGKFYLGVIVTVPEPDKDAVLARLAPKTGEDL